MRNIIVLAFALALATHAWAGSATTGTAATDRVFGAMEKKIIEDFFGKQTTGDKADVSKWSKKAKKAKHKTSRTEAEAGTSGKREELPPGLQNHIEKHGTLPPGLAKKALPPGLADRLGPAGVGLERLIVDNDVVLVEKATGVVLDIIKDIAVTRDK